ncbi:hypothetical protein NMYAN_40103 [Nitrosomonas nitrosa]|uniref:Uncharacterized protein n=1 Tax=Nitrosomonas nitrosa TaxID=52442 RepID=A0A8H8Z1S7_9PROT|nr:hypothetical protein NMYAN_40103 [Nitrosomonas nitrosa]
MTPLVALLTLIVLPEKRIGVPLFYFSVV